jgi:hypothetical protein
MIKQLVDAQEARSRIDGDELAAIMAVVARER